MAETILVTGATGKIGRRVVELLVKEGEVRVLAGVRNLEKAHDLEEAGAHLVFLDLDDTGSVESAVAGADKIFLLTPFDMNMSLQATAVINVAEAARVKRIVRLSAVGAESEPGITLTRMHRSVELAIMGSGIDYTILRPSNFMQNFETYSGSIKEQSAFYLPLGDCKTAIIDCDDIADCAVKALIEPTDEFIGHAYDLTGPESLNNYEIADLFSEALEKPVTYTSVPDDTARSGMVGAGMPGKLAECLIELFEWERAGGAESVSHAVHTITGHSATTFAEYLANNIDKYR